MDNYFLSRDYRQAMMAFSTHLGVTPTQLDKSAMTPFEIQLHSKLADGTNSYELDLRSGSGVSVESKLLAGEIFFCYGMAISVTKYDPAAPSRTKPYLQSPDPGFFPANEVGPLELIWNGDVSITVGSVNKVQKLKANHFRFAPAAGYLGGHAALTALAQYGPSFEERGFFLWGLYPIFSGDEANKISLSLAPGTTTNLQGTAGAGTNNLVFQLVGFKYSGSNGGGNCSI
jgi:hypothetical protein